MDGFCYLIMVAFALICFVCVYYVFSFAMLYSASIFFGLTDSLMILGEFFRYLIFFSGCVSVILMATTNSFLKIDDGWLFCSWLVTRSRVMRG